MSDVPLLGKKVAILIESEYVPGEINDYLELFPKLGADVHLLSNLWYLKDDDVKYFVSDVDEFVTDKPTFEENLAATRAKLEVRKVTSSNDLNKKHPEEYAAVIMAANYTSVRLRWFGPDGPLTPADTPRTAPAVQFFSRAMRNPNIVKGGAVPRIVDCDADPGTAGRTKGDLQSRSGGRCSQCRWYLRAAFDAWPGSFGVAARAWCGRGRRFW